MSIKPEIQERLAAGPDEGQDMTLVLVHTGGDGVSPSNVAKNWVKREHNVKWEDILDAEFAGRGDNGFDRVYLVTWRLEPGQ